MVTNGDAPVSIIAELRSAAGSESHRASGQPVPRLPAGAVEDRLAEWRRILRGSTTQARTVIQRVVQGRITFTPVENAVSRIVDDYEFSAPLRLGGLFSGVASPRPQSLDPSGRTGLDGLGPEDTFDGDYGRLLDRVYGGVEASPTGFEPVFWP